MSEQTVNAQPAENKINSLLVCMGLKVDEAVSQAIMALLRSNSHIVAGVMESAVAIQELELALDQAVFSALEQGDLLPSGERATLVVNISKDLARLGKLAANLGRKVTEVGKHHEHEDFPGFNPWPLLFLICAARPCVPLPGWTRFWLAMPPRGVLPWMPTATMFCAAWDGRSRSLLTNRTCILFLLRAAWSRSRTMPTIWRKTWCVFWSRLLNRKRAVAWPARARFFRPLPGFAQV